MIINKIKINIPFLKGKRNIWGFLNIVFNRVDVSRLNKVGPERACAEWLLRNGAKVKWTNANEYFIDYNSLPPDTQRFQLHIKEIDATDSGISHYGFAHLIGCDYIEKIIFHNCVYLQDQALPMLSPINKSLRHLQISQCGNITDIGITSLSNLANLKSLIVYETSVANKNAILKNLSEKLPNCNINLK